MRQRESAALAIKPGIGQEGGWPPLPPIAPVPWGWAGVASVLVGTFHSVSFEMGGQFFVSELLLLALIPLLIYDRFWRQRDLLRAYQSDLWAPMSVLLLGLLVTFLGYFASDLYRNNDAKDFLRGWARLFFLAADLLGVAMLVSIRRSNIWLLAFGYGFGGALALVIQQVPFSRWKLGYGELITVVAIALICLVKSNVWRGVLLLMVGMVNMALDYRSAAIFAVIVALMLWFNHWSQRGGVRIVGVFLVSVLVIGVVGGGYYATQGEFSGRRQASNSGRLSNAIVGFSAILESPIVGYGSWGRDTRFAKMYADVNFRMNKTEESPLYNFDAIRLATIPAHSQILEAWIEGGMLGIVFFLCYLTVLVRGLHALVFRVRNSALLPLLSFFMISGLWALFMSPFKGMTRFTITLACLAAVIACQLARESLVAGKEQGKIPPQ